MSFLRIFDSHIHPIPFAITPEIILEEMKKNNVEKAVILGMDLHEETLDNEKWRKYFEKQLEFMIFDQNQIIEAMRYILKNGHTPNDLVSKAQNDYPDKFIGFGSVQLGYKNKSYIDNKLKEVKDLDLKGIKLLPTLQFYNPAESKRLVDLFKFAEKHDMVTLLHTGCDPGPWEFPILSKFGNPELLYPILKRFPRVPTILAHLGSYSAKSPAIWFKESIKLFDLLPDNQLFGDISAVPFLIESKKFIEPIKEKIGFDRILYGSDFPVTSTVMEELIDPVVKNNLLNENEKKMILYENAYGIFKNR